MLTGAPAKWYTTVFSLAEKCLGSDSNSLPLAGLAKALILIL